MLSKLSGMFLGAIIRSPYFYMSIAAVLSVVFVTGYVKGVSDTEGKAAKQQVKAVKLAIEREKERQKVEQNQLRKHLEANTKIEVKYKYIDREVIKYAADPDSNCVLGDEWVRIYRAASAGELNGAKGGATRLSKKVRRAADLVRGDSNNGISKSRRSDKAIPLMPGAPQGAGGLVK